VPLVDPNRPSSRFLRAFRTPSCFARPIVITNADFRFVLAEQLRERGVEADIVLEPIRRDSDPAVAVAALLAPERDRFRLTPEETAANEEALRCAVLTLWQTSMLRGNRLKVIDEVANGLSYYDYTFLRDLPHFYAALEDQLAAWDRFELPSFLRVGSWIGGDRDGNPFVTAEMLRQALGMQSERALKFYLDEVHLLGGELSLDGRLVTVSDQLRNLAERSPDRSPRRRLEPYRLAVSGIYARLAATARTFKQAEVSRHAVGEAPPYADAAEFAADLGILYHSLTAKAKKAVARSRAPRAGG